MNLRIHEVLKEKGKTQKWLAEQLSITEPGMNLIINERVNVPLRRLEEIAGILEVSIIELFVDYMKLTGEERVTASCPHCGKDIKICINVK